MFVWQDAKIKNNDSFSCSWYSNQKENNSKMRVIMKWSFNSFVSSWFWVKGLILKCLNIFLFLQLFRWKYRFPSLICDRLVPKNLKNGFVYNEFAYKKTKTICKTWDRFLKRYFQLLFALQRGQPVSVSKIQTKEWR